jgi:DNA methyltransferase 1-associated protein 1
MTSHDVRDMLDLPGEAAPRPAKKVKIAAPRPVLKGLAREVQNLGGDNPIAIVPEVTVFKKRRFGARKPAAKWEQRPFTNSARTDKTFTLRHWRRKEEVPVVPGADGENVELGEAPKPEPEVEDSTFAKYNVQVSCPQYDDEIYNSRLRSAEWTRDETDYLMGLTQEFDLRWPIIWDRYEYTPPVPEMDEGATEGAMVTVRGPRTMEEMKARYYFIAAQMMQVNKKVDVMNGAEYSLLQLMVNYNPATEKARKQFAEAAFTRTKEEAREEESLVLELKRIMARSERLSEERRELYARLEAPASTGNIGIFTSSQGLQTLLQQLMSTDKSKKNRRSIMGGEGVSPAGPSNANQPANFDRRESSVKETISSAGGVNNKKGAQQGVNERRELSTEEKALFGVRIPTDRISTSGPAFRHDKIMKQVTSKSTIQQQKINNVLTEIGVRPRLVMPTFQVGEVFDEVMNGIISLLDTKKIVEKMQGEINLLRAQKEIQDAAQRAAKGEPEPTTEEVKASSESEVKEPEINAESSIKTEEKEENAAATPAAAAPAAGAGARPGSGHKRSASVLSTSSDKDPKRQKK